MFQRLKGAIDSRIAEEQARQKSAVASFPASTSPGHRTAAQRTGSPSHTPKLRRSNAKEEDYLKTKGQDPAEFEAALSIEDEPEEVIQAEAVSVTEEKSTLMTDNHGGKEGQESEGAAKRDNKEAEEAEQNASVELPIEIRTKLRKLEKLETRYQELLRSYRIAHARAVSIEPFEKALKENTPLTTIGDPDALVEYLNQVNLKGDMVMDEFKRVSADRDVYKKKFEDAEKEILESRDKFASSQSYVSDGTGEADRKTDPADSESSISITKQPVSSVLGMFSPTKRVVKADDENTSENFFSYDDEIPRLQLEVQEKDTELVEMKDRVTALENELAATKQVNATILQDFEGLKNKPNISEETTYSKESQLEAGSEEILALESKLAVAGKQLEHLEVKLAEQERVSEQILVLTKKSSKSQYDTLNSELNLQIDALQKAEANSETLKDQIENLEKSKASDKERIKILLDEISSSSRSTEGLLNNPKQIVKSEPVVTGSIPAGKKNNKKRKKKGPNTYASTKPASGGELSNAEAEPDPTDLQKATNLQSEIERLESQIADKDTQIENLQLRRKTEESLREELEIMQENFLTIGEEHVETKQKMKKIEMDKVSLYDKVSKLELEIEALREQAKTAEKVEVELNSLTEECDTLKEKSAVLQTDLSAAQQLATSRYKDLTDLRDVLLGAQPELISLRAENAELRLSKDELAARTSDLRRIEARERDLKSDVASFKKQASDREVELKTLRDKVAQEASGRLRAEDQNRVCQRDMRRLEAEKIQLTAAGEKATNELTKALAEVTKLRSRVRDLEGNVARISSESKILEEEGNLRNAQFNSAQSLLGSMRDQSGEMSMQLKEARGQVESLEEELSEVQRLLSERTREGETMRRLLADVDDRAEAKVREMRERLEAAVDERDRAEDEASTNGRRRAREADELKTKIRDLERTIKQAVHDRDESERLEKEWKKRRDELENYSEKNSLEVQEIRTAMGELRDALNSSEKQARDAERQRGDLRRLLDESNQRFDRLQKESKILQTKQARYGEAPASSSVDSSRVGPPVNGTPTDNFYLKTVLLQFLEQDNKKTQTILIKTILGQLLHLDQKDQERWIAAISAK